MAIRKIRTIGDEILAHNTKPVKKVTPRISMLIGDMLDTMYEARGVGLAAPQVGILKQIVVIDVTEEGNSPLVLINPEIIELSGSRQDRKHVLVYLASLVLSQGLIMPRLRHIMSIWRK